LTLRAKTDGSAAVCDSLGHGLIFVVKLSSRRFIVKPLSTWRLHVTWMYVYMVSVRT